MFLTDVLFSSPRLRFSEAQKLAILNWGVSLNAQSVPTMYGLKKTQEQVRRLVGNPTHKITSVNGNIFYMNDIAHAIAKDYANPLTRYAMQDYPQNGEGRMSQMWHGEKMVLEAPPAPAARVRNRIYFVDELVYCTDNSYFIPERFVLEASQQGDSDVQNSSIEEKLVAIGRKVRKTEVKHYEHSIQ
ncbi:hypothetical protein BC835DRAFT_1274457 [Cytidiella melzeri]|nr:hypothetical protein BC835DRAFT_1274457 [Cytidiella melzeri]